MLAAVGAERRNRKHREGGLEGLEPHGVFDGTPRRVSSPSGDPGGKANRRPDGKSREELRRAGGEKECVYHGPETIMEKLGDFPYRLSANSFFQTNTLQAERMYEAVRSLASLGPKDVVYDLYCGTGAIAIYLSPYAERVVGIELVESSIADAARNAELNHVGNCYFLQGDLKDRLTKDSQWIGEHPRPTVVVTDPPRSGMHAKVVAQIAKLSPEKIVYVSCNPSTQARDAKQLTEAGYSLQAVQPVDMFPHTDHIEAVALFLKQ